MSLLETFRSVWEASVERYALKNKRGVKPSPGQQGFHWITIGAEHGENGQKHGGHPVLIDKDGEMQTGAFKGKTLGEAFGHEKKPEPKPFKPVLAESSPASNEPPHTYTRDQIRAEIDKHKAKGIVNPKSMQLIKGAEDYLQAGGLPRYRGEDADHMKGLGDIPGHEAAVHRTNAITGRPTEWLHPPTQQTEAMKPETNAGTGHEKGSQAVASRLNAADENMLENFQSIGGLTREQAEKALDFYKKNGLLKRDAVGGRHHVTHGALMERGPIRKAAGLDEQAKPKPEVDYDQRLKDAFKRRDHLGFEKDKPGIVMPTKSNAEAKAGDQLGLFGEASAPKREGPATIDLKPGEETKGKQQALFDTGGNANQMDLFGDGVMPEDLVAKESRHPKPFQPTLLGSEPLKKSAEPVSEPAEPESKPRSLAELNKAADQFKKEAAQLPDDNPHKASVAKSAAKIDALQKSIEKLKASAGDHEVSTKQAKHGDPLAAHKREIAKAMNAMRAPAQPEPPADEPEKPRPAPKAEPEPQYRVRDDRPMKDRLHDYLRGTLKPGDEIDVGGNSPAVIKKVNAKSVTTEGGSTWKFGEFAVPGKFKDGADMRQKIEDFERAGGLEGHQQREKNQTKAKAAILKAVGKNPLESVLKPEGLKQVLAANSHSVAAIAEQLAGAMPGMDRAAIRQAILDYRKSNGVEEQEREAGKITIAAKSETPTLDEVEHALNHVHDAGGHFRLIDPDSGSKMPYAVFDNKNQAVNHFINEIRNRATRDHENQGRYDNRNFVKVRGNYKSWLKSHGTNENALMGIDPKHIKAAKEAAVANAQMSLADYSEHMNKVDAGKVTPEEHREAFKKFQASREGIRAELAKLKKEDVEGWHHQDGIRVMSSHGGTTKDKAVESTLRRMAFEFDKTGASDRWTHGEDRDEKLRKAVEGMTDEHLKAHAEGHANETKERESRIKARQDSIDNPKTAQDWMQKRRLAGGYHKLTPEQQAAHDEAYAAHRREQRPFKPPAKTAVEGFKGGTEKTGELGIVQGHHQKRNAPTWTVTVQEHLGDSWKDALSKAKALGGNYVNARIAKAYGATPGFQFFNEDAAKKFHAVMGGEIADVSDQHSAREEERRANQVDSLSDRAAAIKERAEASLGRDRKDNTARRARMAASAEADARNDLATAKTMETLAKRIEDGKAVHLQHVKNKAQVDELDNMLRRAKWNHIGQLQKDKSWNDKSFAEREAMQNAPPTKAAIAHAEYPYPYLHKSEALQQASKLAQVPGLKMFGGRLKKMAEDIGKEDGKDYGQIVDPSDLQKLQEALPKMRRHPSPEVRAIASRFGEKFDAMKRLQGMDITNTAELRAALREYHDLKSNPDGPDPIKEAERKLKRQKIEGFFPTPKTLVERMLDHADIEDGHEVLEPSAGIGSIMDAIKERHPEAKLHGIEKDWDVAKLLDLKGHSHEKGDFLEHNKKYDRIVMNPPFEHRQDEKHVRHAYDLLKPGGKLVAITGSGAHSNERSAGFRDWLSEVGAKTYENPTGSFDTDEAFRKTGVNTHMVIISKPTDAADTDKYSISTEYEPVLLERYAGKDQALFAFGEEHEPRNEVAAQAPRRSRSREEFESLAGDKRLRVCGTSKDVHTCERCGRSDLHSTVCVESLDESGNPTGDRHYYGSDCVGKILGRSTKAIENEALRADQEKSVRSKSVAAYSVRFSPVFLRG